MAINGAPGLLLFRVLFLAVLLTSCGTAQEKTAPCKRPAEFTSYAPDRQQGCAPMRRVNDPAAAFDAIGLD
ncbi:hypothetical protein [Agrobacterium rubi]|uniref:hypothetical protein n=1 Tax=Agrobacterium rubi TaxID=28099 RepID=UPI001F1F1C7E|nr:hypothetical protein [Agrobacterium rubi]